MAKIKKAPTSADSWMGQMKNTFPIAAEHFEKMLSHWQFNGIGHAFGQLTASAGCLEIFLNANDVFMDPKDMKNIEELKSSLERAFKNSEELSESLVN